MNPEPRRTRGHIVWGSVEGRLRSTRSMILASVRPDGRPHAIPTWFWWDGGSALYFITARGTQKQRNLSREPWAVAHFGDGDDVLFVEGPVSVVEDPVETARVDSAYQAKYVDPVSGARASVFENPADDVYRIDLRRVVTWMYGTVGGWTEWRFDSGDSGDSGAVGRRA